MRYASDTSVSVAKSRAEIEGMIQRAGGTKYGIMNEAERACVVFELHALRVMFELPLPNRDSFKKKKNRYGFLETQTEARAQAAYAQSCRSKWRALGLCIKAKLVSVESGVESFEEAFLAHILVPGDDGRAARFSFVAVKAIQQAYAGGQLPPLLPAGGDR